MFEVCVNKDHVKCPGHFTKKMKDGKEYSERESKIRSYEVQFQDFPSPME